MLVAEWLKVLRGTQTVNVAGTELEVAAIQSAPLRTHLDGMGRNCVRFIEGYIAARLQSIQDREQLARSQDAALARARESDLAQPLIVGYERLCVLIRDDVSEKPRLQLVAGLVGNALDMLLTNAPEWSGITWPALSEAIERQARVTACLLLRGDNRKAKWTTNITARRFRSTRLRPS